MDNKTTINMETIKNNFNQYFVDVLKNHYADFKGRANRPMFWYFLLYQFIIGFIAGFVFELIHLPILANLVVLALIVPSLGMSVRRLHDLGKPWYWLLIGIIPGLLALISFYTLPSLINIFGLLQLIGNLVLLVLFCTKGEDKANAWGPIVK